MEKQVGLKDAEQGGGCVVKLDRVQIVSDSQGKPPELEGFRTAKDRYVRQQTSIRTYLRCRELVNDHTGVTIGWQYAPQHRFLRGSKVTFVGDDQKGVRAYDLQPALNESQDYSLLLTELAFDFEQKTGITIQFIERHALFGKSRPRLDRGGDDQLRYGGRRSDKLIRVYPKRAIGGVRVELELHSRLLRLGSIRKLNDLSRAADVIIPGHFQFVHIRWDSLQRHLVERFRAVGVRILEEAKLKAASIYSVLAYLREQRVNNVHRFLVPMAENQLVREAADKWAVEFAGGVL
jgi:hypothetical protein